MIKIHFLYKLSIVILYYAQNDCSELIISANYESQLENYFCKLFWCQVLISAVNEHQSIDNFATATNRLVSQME